MKFIGFTKSFQDLPVPELCQSFRRIGLEGLDLTVRPGGIIAPERVEQELPAAVQAAREAGVSIEMLTTAITDPDANAEKILATAGRQGIRFIKLGYYNSHNRAPLAEQIAAVKRRIGAVSELAAQHGVRPCVHTHSGEYLPSSSVLLYEILKDFRPDQVGAYVDTLHTTLEGGAAGWRQGLDLVAPWLTLLAVKNFAWERTDRDRAGQQRWRHFTCPLADGLAPLPQFVGELRRLNFDGPCSLHSEYKGSGSFRDLNTAECLAQTATDLTYFRGLFSRS